MDELVKFIYELGKYSQEQNIDYLNLIYMIDDECCLRIKTMTTGEVLKTIDAWIYCGAERLIDHRVIDEMDDTSSLFTFLEDQVWVIVEFQLVELIVIPALEMSQEVLAAGVAATIVILRCRKKRKRREFWSLDKSGSLSTRILSENGLVWLGSCFLAMDDKRNKVVITGFGPFGEHDVNASWVVVKLLSTMDIKEDLGVELLIEEIPVGYECVSSKVPHLWEKHKPLLVIHVGVSSRDNTIVLEGCAHKSGYTKYDIFGLTPPQGQCSLGENNRLENALDLKYISSEVNKANLDVITTVSTDAGRYLCEFIYYTSLSIDASRTLFIHVPPLNKTYSAEKMAACIKTIISVIIKDIYTTKPNSL
uniref:Pyroglutamyl-peptidase 1 n=1 Tax=Timema douglasi TaxID=61478 RepID=A0A7R8VHE5_TIMDO|nr:unnamed protein product [Timema douglasi]